MSRITRLCVIPLFAVVLLAAGCSSDSSSDSTTTKGSSTTDVAPVPADLSFTEPGDLIEVEVGDRFVITLDAQPSTGYSWTLASQPDASVVIPDGTSFSSSNAETVGATGTEDLFFVAKGEGSTKIDLQYSQPWDKSAAPYDTATFSVKVAKAQN